MKEDIRANAKRIVDLLESLRDEWNINSEDVLAVMEKLRPGDRLPNGLMVVPEKPTEAMVKASMDVFFTRNPERGETSFDDTMREAYAAMLKAARTEA